MQIQCSACSFLRSSFNDAQQLGQQIGSQNMCIMLHHVTMRFKDSMIHITYIYVFFTYHISYQCQCLQLQIVHIIMYLSRIYFGTGVVKSSMSCYVMLCHVCLLQVCKTFEQLPSSGKQWRWHFLDFMTSFWLVFQPLRQCRPDFQRHPWTKHVFWF